MERLAEFDEDQFVKLTDLVGDPPGIEVVVANIATPAAWLNGARVEVWQALALMAEEKGEWASSSAAWERAAQRSEDPYSRAGDFASASASSYLGGDKPRRDEMLALARECYLQHPRVILEDVRDLAPQDQLDALQDVELRETVDIAVIEGQRALALMLLPDLDKAAKHLAKAAEALPDSVASEAVAVSLLVQRARLNQVEGQNQYAAMLQEANRRALRLRDTMLRRRRWGEAGRLLMLAADALCLQMDFESAHDLLDQTSHQELADPDVADVLGHAAIRALDPKLALRLTENAPRTEGIRSTRAAAVLQLRGSTLAAREAAVEELDDLVAGRGPYALDAAFSRLVYAMEHGSWSDDAEAFLASDGHERPALVLKAFYLGERRSDWEGAYALFDGYSDRRWTLPARLRIAMRWGKLSVLRRAADDVMAEGAGQGLKLECGRAYAKVGDYPRARQLFADVAVDEAAQQSSGARHTGCSLSPPVHT